MSSSDNDKVRTCPCPIPGCGKLASVPKNCCDGVEDEEEDVTASLLRFAEEFKTIKLQNKILKNHIKKLEDVGVHTRFEK